MNEPILEMKNIVKSFPGVKALKGVNLDMRKGEVHALLGENGAGKSTLMKILTGVHQKNEGTIIYKGKEVDFQTPKEAQDAHISIIYQEFNLIPDLTVAENIYIGREPNGNGIFIDDKKANGDAQEILDELNLDISPNEKVKNLTVAKQQMVEIAKALSMNAEILIMDEPTAALTESEIENLFKIINKLKSDGVAIIYISHRLEELNEICDRVTVMRDGEYIKTLEFKDTNLDELIALMVGRKLEDKFPSHNCKCTGKTVLEVKDLNSKKGLKDVNFKLYEGEILGIAGLMGAGRTEVARAIFGADSFESGEIILDGKKLNIKTPNDAIQCGIGYISEDRKRDGVALNMDIKQNITLASLEKVSSKSGFINFSQEKDISNDMVESLKIKTPSLTQKVKNLSGGNQQKVVLGKWMCRDLRVLIFDEPTRGIDVGAKIEVYDLMNKLLAQGVCIIMISSELPEILGMSDRILVMHEGKITGELMKEEATQEKILYYATGNK